MLDIVSLFISLTRGTDDHKDARRRYEDSEAASLNIIWSSVFLMHLLVTVNDFR